MPTVVKAVWVLAPARSYGREHVAARQSVCATMLVSTPAHAVGTPLTAVTRRAMRGLLLQPPPRHMKQLAQAVTNTPPCRATVQVVTKQGSEWVWFCRPLGETHILKEASRIAHC